MGEIGHARLIFHHQTHPPKKEKQSTYDESIDIKTCDGSPGWAGAVTQSQKLQEQEKFRRWKLVSSSGHKKSSSIMRDKSFELLGLLKGTLKYIITSTFELSSIQQISLFFLLNFFEEFYTNSWIGLGCWIKFKNPIFSGDIICTWWKGITRIGRQISLHNIRSLLYPQNKQILKMSSMSKLVLVKSALTWRLRCS